jgi:hypothetical protein
MGQRLFSQTAVRVIAQTLALILAIVISIVLLIAAYGKFFHPLKALGAFDKGVSIFEVLLVALIIFFRKNWRMWLVVAVIFAAWCGYAIYWYNLQLPCSCMGSMVEIPTPISVSLDVIFCAASLGMSRLLGATRRELYLTLLIAFFLALVGYAFADYIYHSFILGH